jgi:hypothetical protein
MPAAKLRPVSPMTTTTTAGHVFAAMIADAFDDRDGARVAHGEALAGDTAEIALALDRTVKHGVADDDRVLRHDRRVFRRPDDDAVRRQALADIVVGVADQVEGDAMGEECAEGLAGGARELDRMVSSGRPLWP